MFLILAAAFVEFILCQISLLRGFFFLIIYKFFIVVKQYNLKFTILAICKCVIQ